MKVGRAVLQLSLIGIALGGCGDRTGILTDEGSTGSVDAGTIVEDDAAIDDVVGVIVCGAPPGGECTLCNGLYYCSDPRMIPSPPCPPGAQSTGPCSADCITCTAPPGYGTNGPFAKTAWFWSCSDGTYEASSFGNVCTP